MSLSNSHHERLFNRTAMVIGVLLTAVVFYRGVTLSITYDEVYTYLLGTSPVQDIMFANKYFYTANNHVLNSLLIKPCIEHFGHHEWVLRLPNMLSFILFYVCCVGLIRKTTDHFILRLMGILLLVMNMYLFDFFSLSRGYGLANAFEAASLWFMLRFIDQRKPWMSLFSFTAAGLAVMANFTWLNFYLPLWLSMNLYIIIVQQERSISSLLKWNIIPFMIGSLLAALCYLPLHYLSKSNEFRWGANAWFDSFHTFTAKYVYSPAVWFTILMQGIILIIFCYAVYLAYKQQKNYQEDLSRLTFILLLIAAIITATISQRLLLGVMYMDGRKSTMYFLLLGLVIISVFNYAHLHYGRKIQWLSLFTIALSLFNMAKNFNPHLVAEWSYDAYTKDALSYFKPLASKKTHRVCASWEFISGLQYYNQYRLNNALIIVDINDTTEAASDIDSYYVRYDQQFQVPKNYTLVNIFPNSHRVYQRISN